MEGYNWEVGTYFTEKEEFVEAIRTYGMHNGRKLKIFRNDKRRICVKCLGAKGTCKWYAYCAYKVAQSTWQLRRITNEHSCSKEFNIQMITSKWLSQRLEKNIRYNPDIKLTNIRNRVGKNGILEALGQLPIEQKKWHTRTWKGHLGKNIKLFMTMPKNF